MDIDESFVIQFTREELDAVLAEQYRKGYSEGYLQAQADIENKVLL